MIQPKTIKKQLQVHPNPKQYLAWQALIDPNIAEIHYGGGAGGGKTWLGCESRITRAYAHPGYKSFIGRNQLTRLMNTCYVSFGKVCKFHGIPDDHWKLNGKYNYIEFINPETGKFDGRGSRIDLLDLSFQPSDPMYERLGSLEYTDGWVDEAGEVPFMAIDILQSRVGRHMNEEFNLNPDTLYTYNPNKGWVYRVYKKYKDGTLDKDIVFIQALYSDNPHTEKIYGKQLDRLKDASMKKRLKEGSFEYDADPASLIKSDAIVDLFSNTLIITLDTPRFMTIDVARHGVDYTVMYLWKGLTLYSVYIYAKQGTDVTSEKAKNIVRDNKIPYANVMADEDGIGGAVVDNNQGFRGFIANSTALPNPITEEKENYGSLKAQSTYKMADLINTHKMAINVNEDDFHSEVEGLTYEVWKDMLIEELEACKSKDIDKDAPLKVQSKDDIKKEIGRSPDFMDTLMMKSPFEYPLPDLTFGAVVVSYPED